MASLNLIFSSNCAGVAMSVIGTLFSIHFSSAALAHSQACLGHALLRSLNSMFTSVFTLFSFFSYFFPLFFTIGSLNTALELLLPANNAAC